MDVGLAVQSVENTITTRNYRSLSLDEVQQADFPKSVSNVVVSNRLRSCVAVLDAFEETFVHKVDTVTPFSFLKNKLV